MVSSKVRLFVCMIILTISLEFHINSRSGHWWQEIVLGTFTSRDWLENFRMSRETFLHLCQQLSDALCRQDTILRKAISVEKRVAVTLWCLATPCEYRTIGHLFGLARSTVCEDRSGNLYHHRTFPPTQIQFPSGSRLDDLVDGFLTKWGVPQCVGAIDGCHVPIACPVMNHTDYYNRKGWYSMILQGVVDHSYRFIDIDIGWPGSVHDARVFAHSSIHEKISEKNLLLHRTISVGGVYIPLFLIGDSAYPLQTWLMKPFTHGSVLTSAQKTSYMSCTNCG